MADLAEAPLCLPPNPLRNGYGLQLPDGTCDSHFHVFAEGAPLASPRSYTPQMETIAGWLALAESFNVARGVLVQPSVYGLDNSVLLDALARHPDRLRGVVVIAPDTPDAELARMHTLGVRSVRINLRNKAGLGLDAIEALAPRIRPLGWHLQFQVGPDMLGALADLTARHDITGVVDHLGFMALNPPGAAVADLQKALDSTRVYTKISAPYRLTDTKDHAGYRAVVATLASSHPERLIWGSDWPHTELFDTVPHEDDLVRLVLDALPQSVHHRVFVANPERLYWSA